MKPTSHQQQTDDGIIRSLDKAGIRARYHRMSLKDVQHRDTKRLEEWVLKTSTEELEHGFTFIGGNDLEDLAILVARGLHVTGRSACVMPMIRFCDWFHNDRDYLEERLDKATALLLTQVGPSEVGDEVFSKRELRFMGTRIDEWISDRNRLLLHSKLPLQHSGLPGELLQRVAQLNETIGEWK
ncbi:hypothetical protein J2J97_31905 (plasmid) [Rhizobium bangladeshense]|uniref:hypothetical protein n=1 Tax=Rhizobium bangladeshense TaxID=1138189 RepID=UPI001A981B4B|nr:hypothetical protein [Rhizobium bangladeshense]QSY98677.1 hypothetical protein J2J97_31905 [Rhizobium bangladeshense]